MNADEAYIQRHQSVYSFPSLDPLCNPSVQYSIASLDRTERGSDRSRFWSFLTRATVRAKRYEVDLSAESSVGYVTSVTNAFLLKCIASAVI
jgi:hypothetical protein